jgi:outer membrane protein assembly factor BamB
MLQRQVRDVLRMGAFGGGRSEAIRKRGAKKAVFAIGLSLALLTFGDLTSPVMAAAGGPGDWPMYMDGPAHNGVNRAETILGPTTVGGLRVLHVYANWAPDCCDTPQVVVGNRAYSVDRRGSFNTPNLFAFNLPSGTVAWRRLIGGGPTGGLADVPAVVNGTLFLGAGAFNATTGRPLWGSSRGATNEIDTVSNGIVYQGGPVVTARNASTGHLLWSQTVPGPCCNVGATTIAGGLAYAISDRLVAYNATTGNLVFSSVTTDMFGTVAVSGGVAYVQGPRHVSAFNAMTGALLWSSFIEMTNVISGTAPAVDGNTVVVGTDRYLIALSATTGSRLWTIDGGTNASYLEPAIANGVVYASSLGHGLQAVDESTGHVLFSYSSFCLGATVSRGTVYADCGDNMTTFGL